MIIRIRSSSGITRFDVSEQITFGILKEKISKELQIDFQSNLLCKSPNPNDQLQDNISLKQDNAKNGEMYYIVTLIKTPEPSSSEQKTQNDVVEDEIDQILEKEDGYIRPLGNLKCTQHGPGGMCLKCSPIEPWLLPEVEPWKSRGVKYMPFHAYLLSRGKRTCDHPKNSNFKCTNCQPLSETSHLVKRCFQSHPPWPEGICSDCRPQTIKLLKQDYRHCDYVQFADAELIDTFLQSFRETGHQRCGFLIGNYLKDENIPLGIKAFVTAIYEPPQVSTPTFADVSIQDVDFLTDFQKANNFSELIGQRILGFIWTSIEFDPKTKKPIKSRDVTETYLFKGEEYLRAAFFQQAFRSKCKRSPSSFFGSKFVSVLLTGSDEGAIVPIAFQVSNQLMEMVRDGLVHTSTKPNELAMVSSTRDKFVPEVVFSQIGKSSAMTKADPDFPSDYFYVEVGSGSSTIPVPFFKKNTFPKENRPFQAPGQNPQTLCQHLACNLNEKQQLQLLLQKLSDFSLLLYLNNQILDQERMKKLLEVVRLGSEPQQINPKELLSLLPFLAETPASPANENIKKGIEQLVAMGFDRTASELAMDAARGDLNTALSFLQ